MARCHEASSRRAKVIKCCKQWTQLTKTHFCRLFSRYPLTLAFILFFHVFAFARLFTHTFGLSHPHSMEPLFLCNKCFSLHFLYNSGKKRRDFRYFYSTSHDLCRKKSCFRQSKKKTNWVGVFFSSMMKEKTNLIKCARWMSSFLCTVFFYILSPRSYSAGILRSEVDKR